MVNLKRATSYVSTAEVGEEDQILLLVWSPASGMTTSGWWSRQYGQKSERRIVPNRLDKVFPEIAKDADATEQLKEKDQMKWVGLMDACKNQVEEIILKELIYGV